MVKRIEGILRGEYYLDQDLIGFFAYQMRMKIRTDRKRLISPEFSKTLVRAAFIWVGPILFSYFRLFSKQQDEFLADPTPC